MSKLVLIGGPPCVGKSSALKHLAPLFQRCACLDADDVWRVRPTAPDDPARAFAVTNVLAVLRGYLEAGVPLVFLAWVLANPLLIERLLRELHGLYDSSLVVHLVASRPVLEARVRRVADPARPLAYALAKLGEIERLPTPKLDTSALESAAVAAELAALVRADGG